MNSALKKIISKLFAFVFFIYSTLFIFHTEKLYASETAESKLTQKISKSYTNKFCNAIGFGLSKESAMNFSLKETIQEFNKRKEFNDINKDLLSETISTAVIEKCGYPINLKGEKGIQEFKKYYLSKQNELK